MKIKIEFMKHMELITLCVNVKTVITKMRKILFAFLVIIIVQLVLELENLNALLVFMEE